MRPHWLPKRRDWLHIIALTTLVALAFQGSRGLFETTEGRYAEVAREMNATGDWWVPHLEGRPHWTKPPLTYWAVALSLRLAGTNAWGARLPNAIAFIATTFIVGALGSTLWSRREGWAAATLYGTALGPVVAMNNLSTDTLLACFAAITALTWWRALRAREQGGSRERRWVLIFWLAVGLGFLTKGPPSLLTPAAVAILHFIRRVRGETVPTLTHRLGIALSLLIALGWFVAVTLQRPELFRYFVGAEIVDRVASDRFGRNPEWWKPAVVYLPPLVLGLGGWIVFWPSLGRAAARRGERLRAHIANLARHPQSFFLVLWLLPPLVVLSLSRSRLPLYVLPLFPVVPLLTARMMAIEYTGTRLRRALLPASWAFAVLLVAAKALSAHVPASADMRALHDRVASAAADLARTTGSDHSLPVALLETRNMHGLQFYFDGALIRTPDIAELAETIAPDTAAVVVSRGKMKPHGAGLRVDPAGEWYGFTFWSLRVLTPGAPDDDGV